MSQQQASRRQLRVLREVMRALASSQDLSAAARSLLEAIGGGLGWDLGSLWAIDPTSGLLRAFAVWHPPDIHVPGFESATLEARFASGEGIPGKVLQTGSPAWVEDVTLDPSFTRAASAAREGLRSALAFPIATEQTVLGVIEFFDRNAQPPDADLLETLSALGRQIGLYIARGDAERNLLETERRSRQELETMVAERTAQLQLEIAQRRRVEARLHESQAKLQQLYRSDIIGIIVADNDGHIKEANDAFLKLVGYSRDELERGEVRWDQMTPPEWRESDERAVHENVTRGFTQTTEKEFIVKNGARVPIMYAGARLEGSSSDSIAFVLDITELKRTQRELASLNESLERRVSARTHSLVQSQGRLAESERMLRALAARIETIREQERVDLAREIHDVLGQELTGLKMDGTWVLRRLAAPTLDVQRASERLQAMIQQIDSTVATVRRIATSLRPGVLDDLGLIAALQWQAREFEARSGITVEIDVPRSEVAVDDARATAVFRIFQELLTNVARHAQASRVRAALSYEQNALVLDVADDGRGIKQPDGSHTTSLGLLGIRERAFAFGGELTISAASAQGTLARVSIPLTKNMVQA